MFNLICKSLDIGLLSTARSLTFIQSYLTAQQENCM